MKLKILSLDVSRRRKPDIWVRVALTVRIRVYSEKIDDVEFESLHCTSGTRRGIWLTPRREREPDVQVHSLHTQLNSTLL